MFDGLLLVLPALVGVVYGAGLARWWSDGSSGRPWAVRLRRVLAAAFALVVLAGGEYVAQPARTDPIPGADGAPLAGSIAELTTAHVGGHDTGLMLRGQSATAPVLLFLAVARVAPTSVPCVCSGSRSNTTSSSPPGTSAAPARPTEPSTRPRRSPSTRPSTTRSSSASDCAPGSGRTASTSWATPTARCSASAPQRPDLFAAYVGTGQMVSPVETDRIFYDDTISWATRTGDDALLATLRRNGPPPYASVFPYEAALTHERDWNDYARVRAYAAAGELPATGLCPSMTSCRRCGPSPRFLDSFAALYPQLQDIDFRTQATRLQVPVYLVEGEHEARGRAVPAREWFDALDAPAKTWVEMPQSGHRPGFEQPVRFAAAMRAVLAETR